jgi:oligo-1,6-glucosidase
VNVSGEERALDLGEDWPVGADGGWGTLVLGSYPDAGEPTTLRPWEARVVRRG